MNIIIIYKAKKLSRERGKRMNGKKIRGKRTLSLALAALMVLTLGPGQAFPGTVYAEESSGYDSPDNELTAAGEGQTYVPDASGIPDPDELFAGYAMQVFYGDSGISLLSNYGEAALDDYNLFLYRELKDRIKDIAANGGSTEFTVTLDEPITWESTAATSEALGLEAAEAFQNAGINFSILLECLLADCPYELYWFDKTEGMGSGYSSSASGGTGSISELTFTMAVVPAYQASASGNVDPAKAGAAAAAAQTARQIAADHANESDYAKMLAFKNEICRLVDYNHDAAAADYEGGFGDPWQLIYVFDNDPDTKVVCEGYSKAFQYLCDLSGLTCYTVTGTMTGGTGAGGHMWNIVTLGGKNYLVDVTNSDAGTAGQDGGLFLAGYDTGSWDSQYSFNLGSSNVISYAYDTDQSSLYGERILTLAQQDYDPAAQEPQAEVKVSGPQGGKVPYGTAPELTAAVVSPEAPGNAAYQWYQVSEYGTAQAVSGADKEKFAPSGLGIGSYTYYCVVNCDGYEITSGQITVTVEKAVLTPSITGTLSKVYDGTRNVTQEQGLSISLSGAVEGEDVYAAAASYMYDSKDAGAEKTITASGITLSGNDMGNYTLAAATAEAKGSISKRPVTVTPAGGQSKAQGEADPELTWTVTGGSLADGEELSGALSRESGETAGTYNITLGTLGTLNPNYDVTLGGNVTFEIRPGKDISRADVTVEGTYIYNGSPQIPELKVILDGVTLEKDSGYTVSASQNTNAGTAQYTITGTGSYSGKKTGTFTIQRAEPVYSAPQGLSAEYGTALSAVALTNPAGNTPGTWEWKNDSAVVDKVGEKTYTAVFTPTDTLNYTSPHETGVTVTGTDSVAPTGEITIAGSSWREFLNNITFGYFFKETQGVNIEGEDNTGTEVTICYLISDQALTAEELEQASGWTAYGDTFYIGPDRRAVVYAEITDESGNSAFISSDGIVLYTDAQASDTAVSYTRTGTEDVTVKVELNGNTVAGIRNGDSVLKADTDYTVDTDGTVTFKAGYLKTLAAEQYTLKISYDPQGMEYTPAQGSASQAPEETEIVLTVKKMESSVSGISDLSRVYDSTPVGTPAYQSTGTGSVTIEYKKKGEADSAYTAEAPEDAGEYTVRVSLSENEDYTAASAEADFTVSTRQTSIQGTSVQPSKVYDGTAAAVITDNGTLTNAVDGDDIKIIPGTAEYADKNAGSGKEVSFKGFTLAGGDASNYVLNAQPADVTAEITKKELTVNVSVADKVFDGTVEAEIESAELIGTVTGDEVALHTGQASFTDSAAGNDIPVQFTEFTISGKDAGNYKLCQPEGVTADIAEYAAQKGTDYTVNSNGWLREDFIVTAGEGRLLSTDISAESGEWKESLSASGETASGQMVFYVKNTETGAVSMAVTESYKIDRTAPEGTIRIGGHTWKGLQEEFSFETFFRTEQEVTVSAEDTLSLMSSSEYYVSDSIMSREELEEVTGWTPYNALRLDEEGRYIVYAKLTDTAGNISYVSSDGIVIDRTAPEITGVTDGGEYFGSAAFHVDDEYLDTVTIDGQEVAVSEDGYTLPADNAEHTVRAGDRAGNETVFTFGVYRIYTVTVPEGTEGYTVRTDAEKVNYNGSYTFTVTLADGYSKTEDFAVRVNGTAVEPQADGRYMVSGVQEDQKITAEGVADITAPEAQVTVEENSWKSFLNTITFGLFFRESKTVEITASDAGSGVDTVQYYVSDTALDREEIAAVDSWNSYSDAFSIDREDTCIIYAKAADRAGNTVYISSDGMVFDYTAPVFEGLTDGHTYYSQAVFSVSDDWMDRVDIDGQRVEPGDDGSYTIPADNRPHTVTAYDRAGNSRICTVNVYHTYTVTFTADGKIAGEMTVGYGDDVSADRYPDIPAKEGFTETPPYWSLPELKNVSSDITVTAVYIPDGAVEIPQPDTGDEKISTKLIVETGISEVPEALKAIETLDTPEKIGNALMAKLLQSGADAGEENTVLYDVTLMVDLHDGRGWIPAGPEHFSEDGKMTVTLPYPEGTGKDTHNFTVAHMFTSDVFGKRPGDIETPAVTKTESGIRFEVTGLSPIMVSWEKVKPAADTPQADADHSAGQGNTAVTPHTGDSSKTALLLAAAALFGSLLAAGTAVSAKRSKK